MNQQRDNLIMHRPECAVIRERTELALMIGASLEPARQHGAQIDETPLPRTDVLLGAWVECFGGGDQEVENCDCGAVDKWYAAGQGVPTVEPEIDVIVSAGHGEYGPTSGPLVTEVWNPHDEEIWGALGEAQDAMRDPDDLARLLYEHLWSDSNREEAAAAAAGADLTWEILVRVRGSKADVVALFEALQDEVSGGPQGGDDDTYDYWPSGVRYAQALAAVLGREAEMQTTLREALDASEYSADDLGLVV